MRTLLLVPALTFALMACNSDNVDDTGPIDTTDTATSDTGTDDTGDTNTAPPPPLPPLEGVGTSSGGGRLESANHTLNLVIGDPIPAAGLSTPNHRLTLGVGTFVKDRTPPEAGD